MSLIKTSKRNKLLVSLALLSIIAIGYYLSVYNAYSYKSSNDTTGSAIVIIGLMIYPMLWLDMEKTKTQKVLRTVLMVVISITAIVMLMILRGNYESSVINANPVITQAHIVGFETEKSLKGKKTEYAVFSYTLENKEFRQRIYDDNYTKGQTLKIRFSREYPEMYEVIEYPKISLVVIRTLSRVSTRI
jgi:multisubunit Na+/H+ antiporter MnhG subunit